MAPQTTAVLVLAVLLLATAPTESTGFSRFFKAALDKKAARDGAAAAARTVSSTPPAAATSPGPKTGERSLVGVRPVIEVSVKETGAPLPPPEGDACLPEGCVGGGGRNATARAHVAIAVAAQPPPLPPRSPEAARESQRRTAPAPIRPWPWGSPEQSPLSPPTSPPSSPSSPSLPSSSPPQPHRGGVSQTTVLTQALNLQGGNLMAKLEVPVTRPLVVVEAAAPARPLEGASPTEEDAPVWRPYPAQVNAYPLGHGYPQYASSWCQPRHLNRAGNAWVASPPMQYHPWNPYNFYGDPLWERGRRQSAPQWPEDYGALGYPCYGPHAFNGGDLYNGQHRFPPQWYPFAPCPFVPFQYPCGMLAGQLAGPSGGYPGAPPTHSLPPPPLTFSRQPGAPQLGHQAGCVEHPHSLRHQKHRQQSPQRPSWQRPQVQPPHRTSPQSLWHPERLQALPGEPPPPPPPPLNEAVEPYHRVV